MRLLSLYECLSLISDFDKFNIKYDPTKQITIVENTNELSNALRKLEKLGIKSINNKINKLYELFGLLRGYTDSKYIKSGGDFTFNLITFLNELKFLEESIENFVPEEPNFSLEIELNSEFMKNTAELEKYINDIKISFDEILKYHDLDVKSLPIKSFDKGSNFIIFDLFNNEIFTSIKDFLSMIVEIYTLTSLIKNHGHHFLNKKDDEKSRNSSDKDYKDEMIDDFVKNYLIENYKIEGKDEISGITNATKRCLKLISIETKIKLELNSPNGTYENIDDYQVICKDLELLNKKINEISNYNNNILPNNKDSISNEQQND